MRTEDLIAGLAADLRPVRRMASPALQAALWLAGAAATIAAVALLHGLRPDLAERLRHLHESLQVLASIGTGAAAALAAAMLARPDRSGAWLLLPLPFLLAWLVTMGVGCLEDAAQLGPGALVPHLSLGCIQFILLLGVPLAAGLLLLLRHAGPVRPGPVLLLAGLASAALCSAGLSLFHHLDAALEVLLSHGLAIALVALAGRLAGRPLLLRAAVG